MSDYLSQIDLNNRPTNYAGSAQLSQPVVYGPAYPGPVYGPTYSGPMQGPVYSGPQVVNQPVNNNLSGPLNQTSPTAAPTSPQPSGNAQAGNGYIQINPDWFKLPDQNQQDQWLKDAYAKLKPYYDKLLAEAQGDLNEATRRLDYDYSTGSRYNQEDFSILTGRTNEDAVASLKSLGLAVQSENEQQQDTQNKRGIALTQNENRGVGEAQPGTLSYDVNGNPVVAGTGRAGFERTMVREDQGLRREAINRSKNRALQDIGINYNRKSEDLANTKATGTYDTQAGYRDKRTGLINEQDQKAAAMGESAFNRTMQQKSLSLQQASLEAQNKALGSS